MAFFVSYILPVIYLVLLSFLLQRNRYLRQHGFSRYFIAGFFVARCIAGMVSDYLAFQYLGDVTLYYGDGLQLYQTLKSDPGAFAAAVKQMFSISDFNILSSQSGFIRAVFEGIKFIHFIADIFSFGNVYTNTILFNGLITTVLLRCWVFLNKYSGSRVAGAWLFLMPSAFFYTSNILKEGLCFALIAALLPLCYEAFAKISPGKIIKILVLFVALFFFKFIIAILFGIAVTGWYLFEKYPAYKKHIIISGVVFCTTFFFGLKLIVPSLDLPALVVHRQQEFIALKARSEVPVQIPEPTFTGFLKVLPSALNNVLLKPLPGEGGKTIYLVNSIEIFVYWGLLIFLWIRNRFALNTGSIRPLYWAFFFYAAANLAIIGFIVPNIGALVRYRSIFLPWPGIFCWYLFNGNGWLKALHAKYARQ